MLNLGGRVRQARLLAGYTQDKLSEELKKWGYAATKAVISKYEKNKSMPPAQFLILAASILDVPASYFTHQPTLSVEWLAFRRHSALPTREQEAIKQYATDVAELQIELQSLLYPKMVARLPERISVNSPESAEKAAMALRTFWGLDNHPIDSLVRTAEDHQVVVVGWHKHAGEFDGLSGWCNQKYPITVVNTLVDAERRRFTLAHELGHLVMDTSEMSEKESEKFANRFAATFLVPADCAIDELGTRRTNLDWDELKILKRKYGLSMSAWVHRAQDLDIISKHYANQLCRERDERGWHHKEPVDYLWDEIPSKLEQMARRTVSEGLINPEQIHRVFPKWVFETEMKTTTPHHLTVYDLLKMPEAQRQQVMAEAFALAANEDFETFEAFDDMDFNDDAF